MLANNKNFTTPLISKILQAAIQPEVFGHKIKSTVKVQDKKNLKSYMIKIEVIKCHKMIMIVMN